MPDLKRIEREIRQCIKDSDTSVQVEPINDNLCHLKGSFNGPSGTVYEGGTFLIDIIITDTYPFAPPKMKFLTKIYHPNISSQTGAICLDILKDAWTPVFTLKTVLISLQSLLCDPVPDDPQDAQVASHYLKDRKGFEQTAREWTMKYANGKEDPEFGLDQEAIKRLLEMGFERSIVVKALKMCSGKEQEALEYILTNL
jgi:ubiquitin-conjugating enzyme (huntingtin interacting protein 2)